jgi:branched-chain amino acid transport system permease protein
MLIIPAAAAALLGGFKRLDLAVVGGLLLGLINGMVAQIGELALVRNFVPLLFIVILLLWSQRKEVWDAAR